MYIYMYIYRRRWCQRYLTLIQDNQKIVVGLLAECCGSSEEVCMYVYDVCLCICMHMYAYVCMYVCMCVRVCVSVCVCVCTCTNRGESSGGVLWVG